MSTINLNSHRTDLLNAFNKVIDTNSPINWALYSYEGSSNVLKVHDTGDGGLEELLTMFNSGRIMYGLAAIPCPATNVPKILLIHWQGDGVATTRLGICASHIQDVKHFLKSIHVTHHARNDDDLDLEVLQGVLARVTSAVQVSSHFSSMDGAQKPVGSVYKKVVPGMDIDLTEREKFWAETERSEEERRKEEHRRMQEQTKELEAEKKRLESRLHHQCEVEVKEHKTRSRLASDQLRMDRQQDASQVIGHKSQELRSMWQQQGRPEKLPPETGKRGPPVAPKMTNGTMMTNGQTPPVESRTPPPPTVVAVQPQPPRPSPPSAEAPRPPESPPPPPVPTSPVPKLEEGRSVFKPPSVSSPTTAAAFSNALPPRPDSDEEEEEQEWETPPPDTGPQHPTEDMEAMRLVAGQNEVAPQKPRPIPGKGIQAWALWDYQAADDTEISFDPGDVICQIDMVDPGWWRGVCPGGAQGLFPANFVELMD